LKDEHIPLRVLQIVDEVTASLSNTQNRRQENFKILRLALAYCWSVAVAVLPVQGKVYMEKWFLSVDQDVQWVMRENLKKARMERIDPIQVQEARQKVPGFKYPV
jgi:hypothetical protein